MKRLAFIATILASLPLQGACIGEKIASGAQVKNMAGRNRIWIASKKGQFVSFGVKTKLKDQKNYYIQYRPISSREILYRQTDYDKKYLRYYNSKRMGTYLHSIKANLNKIGYGYSRIGTSIKGKDLYFVGPQKRGFSRDKKTIVMFGRHHGDEGTANWIIEGFLNTFLRTPALQDHFNLLLYPMINPDGADARTRYNANGRDLNRMWMVEAKSSPDEIKIVYGHLERFLLSGIRPVIVLDMHGSFTKDFIFRVDRNFKGSDFYNMQQEFIDSLGKRDPWQAGTFTTTNGHKNMSRIRLISRFGLHALTHETIRDIPLKNKTGRTVGTLMNQGRFVAASLLELYAN